MSGMYLHDETHSQNHVITGSCEILHCVVWYTSISHSLLCFSIIQSGLLSVDFQYCSQLSSNYLLNSSSMIIIWSPMISSLCCFQFLKLITILEITQDIHYIPKQSIAYSYTVYFNFLHHRIHLIIVLLILIHFFYLILL